MVEQCQRRGRLEQTTKTLCIGGGAGSEILALASLIKELNNFKTKMQITSVDCADWRTILEEMGNLIETRWKMSSESYSNTFRHEDILDTYKMLPFSEQHVITSLFTTNELFAASRVKTMALLSHLSEVCQSGTLLIVAESTGTYSEIQMGSKTYPLELVLDMTLAGKNKAWTIVQKDQSLWYRVPEASKKKYALQIENTHMMLRVYKKL